jgi:NAD(P)-dependent dehydrogenase (short-subunit alcohol dehydrogenase family)
MRSFQNKVAVITGAASGIGLASARALANEGMHVVLLDNREADLKIAVESIHVEGSRTLGLTVDVTDAAAVEKAAEQVVAEFGAVHLLMNNAAVFIRGPDIVDVEDDVWEWLLGVNLYGTLHCIRSFLPKIQEHNEEGHVVNTCSLSGLIVRPRKNGVYATSKYALVGLSEALAHDLEESNINVSVLLPAAVASDFYLSSAEHRGTLGGENMFASTPEDTANGMSPDEVAARLLDGIRDKRFYIATHSPTRAMLETKHRELMAAYDAADAFNQVKQK